MNGSKSPKKRKVCFIITNPIHYSRNLLVLEELKRHKNIDLSIIIGGAALLPKFSAHDANTEDLLRKGGFTNIRRALFHLDGDSLLVKAKTSGLGIVEFSSIFDDIRPDIVVVRGDRFEVLAAAIAAAYMNIPVAHIEGGDESGTIDESVRHAISKLAHIHFTTNEQSRNRLIQMGEQPDFVYNVGSPDVELAMQVANTGEKYAASLKNTGSGFETNPNRPFVIVMYHPVTTELDSIARNTKILLRAVYNLNIPALWFWPNVDAGAEIISHEIRFFKDTTPRYKIRFLRYLPPKIFLTLLKNTLCLVGNSSAGIKECAYFGTPVVNVGSRQDNRLRAENVLDVGYNVPAIERAVKLQIRRGKYPPSTIYSCQDTSKKIAAVLASVTPCLQKRFFEQ